MVDEIKSHMDYKSEEIVGAVFESTEAVSSYLDQFKDDE